MESNQQRFEVFLVLTAKACWQVRKLKSEKVGRELVKHWLKYNYLKFTVLIILGLFKNPVKVLNLAFTCIIRAPFSGGGCCFETNLPQSITCCHGKITCLWFWGQVFQRYLLSVLFLPYGAVHPVWFIRVCAWYNGHLWRTLEPVSLINVKILCTDRLYWNFVCYTW